MHAKIPGAINLALFTDSERAKVGTCYKQIGKNEAIDLGVQFVGPKLHSLLQNAKAHRADQGCKLYCWRGGMRSGFLRQFLEFTGCRSFQLEGGYKAFRRRMMQELEKPLPLVVIGGMTGSGKTELLSKLQVQGEEVVDLEAIACHRGSVFGELVGLSQPSAQQFENELAFTLYNLQKTGAIFVEDESRLIGSCMIPNRFFMAMRKAPLLVITCSEEERIERIHRLYGTHDQAWWVENTKKVAKKLGGARTETVIRYIEQGMLVDAIRLLLLYYDEKYRFSMQKHEGPVHFVQDWKEIIDANSQSFYSVCR